MSQQLKRAGAPQHNNKHCPRGMVAWPSKSLKYCIDNFTRNTQQSAAACAQAQQVKHSSTYIIVPAAATFWRIVSRHYAHCGSVYTLQPPTNGFSVRSAPLHKIKSTLPATLTTPALPVSAASATSNPYKKTPALPVVPCYHTVRAPANCCQSQCTVTNTPSSTTPALPNPLVTRCHQCTTPLSFEQAPHRYCCRFLQYSISQCCRRHPCCCCCRHRVSCCSRHLSLAAAVWHWTRTLPSNLLCAKNQGSWTCSSNSSWQTY